MCSDCCYADSEETQISEKQLEEIKKIVGEDKSCFILITCDHPAEDGYMPVQMTVDGDPDLAACLLLQAHDNVESQMEQVDQ